MLHKSLNLVSENCSGTRKPVHGDSMVFTRYTLDYSSTVGLLENVIMIIEEKRVVIMTSTWHQ